MTASSALKLAVDIMQVPSRITMARAAALPAGITELLQIVANEPEVVAAAVQASGRPAETVRAAAQFFIEQVLLAPGANSYRILGVAPDADVAELRQNMALLMRWLHPDAVGPDSRAIFATRVTAAWESVKSPARREAYDRSIGLAGKGAVSEYANDEPAAGPSRRSSSRSRSKRSKRGGSAPGRPGLGAILANMLFGSRR